MPELDIFQKFLAAPNLKIVLLSPLIFISFLNHQLDTMNPF